MLSTKRRFGKMAQKLNAFFSPRAYGFVDGRLVWMQKRVGISVVETLQEFLKTIKGEKETEALLNAWSAEMREKAWGKSMADIASGGKQHEAR